MSLQRLVMSKSTSASPETTITSERSLCFLSAGFESGMCCAALVLYAPLCLPDQMRCSHEF